MEKNEQVDEKIMGNNKNSILEESVDNSLKRKTRILLGTTIILLLSLTIVLGRGQSIPSYIIDSKIKKEVDKHFILLDDNIKKQLEGYSDSTVILLNVGYYKQDTCLENEMKYLVSKSSQEVLGQYIEEENVRLTWLGIIITALVTLIGIGFPLYIRDKSEKRFEEITKRNEQRITNATQRSSNRIDDIAKNVVFELDSRIDSIDKKKEEMDSLVEDIRSTKDEQSSIIKQMTTIKNDTQIADGTIKRSVDDVNKLISHILEFTYLEKERRDDVLMQILIWKKDDPYYEKLINKFTMIFLQDGNMLRETDNYQKAIICYSNYISIAKNTVDPVAYYNRGSCYYSLKDYKKAIDDFTFAIDNLGMSTKDIYNYRGSAYFSDQQYDKAIDDFNQSIIIDSNFEEAYINLAATYKALENYPKALQYYRKAIELKTPRIDSDYLRRAEEIVGIVEQPDLLREARNEDNSDRKIALYKTLVHQNPTIARLYYELGMAYLDNKNINDAIVSIQSAIDNDTNNNEYKLYLQLVQHLRNILENAKTDTAKAIKEAFEGVSKSPNMTWFKYFEQLINTLVPSTKKLDN